MSFSTRIEWDDRRARAALERVQKAGADLEPLLMSVGEGLILSTAQRASREIAPDGSAWLPLAPSTQARKRGPKMLSESGDMLRTAYTTTRDELVFGTSDFKASFHQFGTAPYTIRPKTKKALWWPGAGSPRKSVRHPGLPARPFIGISDDDLDMIDGEAIAYLDDAWSGT